MLEHKKVSGLSGNEIYCLSKLDMKPGAICVGNSVVSIGVGGGLSAGLSTLGGGEVQEVTELVHKGREASFRRMLEEAKSLGGIGITGVSFDLVNHGGNLEFISIGSTVHSGDRQDEKLSFSTSANAQQFFCQVDCGFKPLEFIFGNVAYSIGLGGGISGAFSSLKRGEVPEYTEIFDQTRHLALQRLRLQARAAKANCVVGVETNISFLMGAQEMIMIGTASHNERIDELVANGEISKDILPLTSDMTSEEMWSMASLGYIPLGLVMGVSVYSIGFTAGIRSFFKTLGGGEVGGLTEILYEAREKALARIQLEANRLKADEVIGVKTYVYDLGGGLVEFMAIGTAVKKVEGIKTKSQQLPPQALVPDRDTLVDSTFGGVRNLDRPRSDSATKVQKGPASIIAGVIIICIYILVFIFKLKSHR